MPLAPEYFTADQVRALPDDGSRYEVVWGELLVTPAPVPLHQRTVGRLFVALVAYCARFELGEPFVSPADISWGADSLVQLDVFVVAPEHAGAIEWSSIKSLRLVAEVLSPSTAPQDRFQKRRLYQSEQVETLWLVDPTRKLVEVWTPEGAFPTVEAVRIVWHPEGAPEPLVIPLEQLFN